MANKLKIYACSGVGNTQRSGYDYWTDNTNSLANTQAVNTLLAKINLLYSEVENLAYLTDAQVVERLNSIDCLCVCLVAAQDYAQHYTHLEKAGAVIGSMLADGLFQSDSLDNAERDLHLDQLIAEFEVHITNDIVLTENAKFAEWWTENVVRRNKVGFDASQRAAIENALAQTNVSGIGELNWRDNKELAEYLTKGSQYFLYTFFTDTQLNRIPQAERLNFRKKRTEQRKVYEHCKSLYVGSFGSEESMQNIIRASIMADYKDTPENVCEEIANGKRKTESVGITPALIVTIIATIVLPVLMAIIDAICKAASNTNANKYASIDQQAIEASCPNEDDFAGLDMGSISQTASIGLPIILLIGAAIFSLVKRKKSK